MDSLIIIIAAVIGGILLVVALVVFIIFKKNGGTLRNSNHTGGSSLLASSLRNEKQKSEVVISAIADGVILLDKNLNIQLFNPAAQQISGWQKEDALTLVYSSVIQLVNDKDVPYTSDQDPFRKAAETLQPVRDNKATMVTKSNKRVSISIIVSPLLSDKQQLDGLIAVFRDVSEERDEEHRRAEFISTASHEMRTPVAAIEGYLALALNEKVCQIDAKAREYLNKAHSSTQHLGKLFQDLLTSTKAEDGRLSSSPQVVEMGLYLEHLVEDLRIAAQKKGLDVAYQIGASGMSTEDKGNAVAGQKMIRPLYYTFVDPERVREVITNLFDNGVKYSEKGTLTIGITGDDKVVQLRVSDQGMGIPAEDIPHLFQKFYRVDNSATRTIGGTGLGLFICRKIVELYNGKIWVESQIGQGTTFFINVPRLSNDRAQQLLAKEAKQNELSATIGVV